MDGAQSETFAHLLRHKLPHTGHLLMRLDALHLVLIDLLHLVVEQRLQLKGVQKVVSIGIWGEMKREGGREGGREVAEQKTVNSIQNRETEKKT